MECVSHNNRYTTTQPIQLQLLELPKLNSDRPLAHYSMIKSDRIYFNAWFEQT